MNVRRRSLLRRLTIAAFLLGVAACRSATGLDVPNAELRIFFVGNSLSYSNDLPGLVATIAESAGRTYGVGGVLEPGYGLVDHWLSRTQDEITAARPDVVIFQQGTTSLASSLKDMLQWTDSFAPIVHAAGATPAFLMVWPETARLNVFDAVRDNYRTAAQRAEGIFIPAGEAWRALIADPTAPTPYANDGFHPSEVGSTLAAYVIVRTLTGQSVQGLPGEFKPSDGSLPTLNLSPALALLLQRLADEAVDANPPR